MAPKLRDCLVDAMHYDAYRLVSGNLAWGRDRVYFYAQPVAGGGGGAVCYATLDPGEAP